MSSKNKIQTQPAPQSRAELKYLRGSAKKVRLVVDLIRGKKVEEALNILRFTQKYSAKPLAKLLRSVVASASQKGNVDIDQLYLSRALVNDGPMMKRFRPRAMGRANQILKRSCHIVFEVST